MIQAEGDGVGLGGTVPASGTHGPGLYASVLRTVAPVPAFSSEPNQTHDDIGLDLNVTAGTVPEAGTVP
jgi:hypothetical protein